MWSNLSLVERRAKVEAAFQQQSGFKGEQQDQDDYYYGYRDFLSEREYDLRQMMRTLKDQEQLKELTAEHEAVDIEWHERYADDDSDAYDMNLACAICRDVGRDI